MKTLTETLGSATHIDGGISRDTTVGENEHTSCRDSEGLSGSAPDHAVVVSISSSSGYEDSETFALPDAKTAKAFARRLMSTCVRAYDRRDWSAE